MSVTYNSTPRDTSDASGVSVTTGTGSLGGTIGVSVIIDDAVLTSKSDALRHIEAVAKKITEQTWPAA